MKKPQRRKKSKIFEKWNSKLTLSTCQIGQHWPKTSILAKGTIPVGYLSFGTKINSPHGRWEAVCVTQELLSKNSKSLKKKIVFFKFIRVNLDLELRKVYILEALEILHKMCYRSISRCAKKIWHIIFIFTPMLLAHLHFWPLSLGNLPSGKNIFRKFWNFQNLGDRHVAFI